MVRSRSTPTTRQRELAERLRDLRQAQGLTVESVAQSLMVHPSKISRLETASRRPSPRDVRDLCQLYSVSDDERNRLMALAAQALETAWYQDVDLDAAFRTFVGLEEAASVVCTLQTNMIPGLLQTASYARVLVAGIRTPLQMPEGRLDEIVSARMRRQEILRGESPPRLHAVIDEAALRRPLGPAHVMAEQVSVLLDWSEKPFVTVQVIPFDAGAHPGLDGRFSVLQFDNPQVRDTVYVEGLLGELFLDKDQDVRRYLETFRYVSERVALTDDESGRLLAKIQREWSER